MKTKRIKWIDNAKGLLIILVVVGHVVSSYKAAGMTNDFYKVLSSIIYSFHMACFIFIGGYLCKIKKDISKSTQVKNKLISYGIPYIIFSFVWVIFKMIFSKYTNTSVDLIDFVLILIFPISFMWYLYATMLMSILQINIEKLKRIRIPIIVLSGILLCLVPIIKRIYPIFSDIIICDFISFWLYFLIGHYYGNEIIKISKNKIVLLMSLVLFSIMNIILLKVPNDIQYYCKIITSLVGTFLIIGCFNYLKNSLILEYCGKKSLSIYVLQGIVIAATRIIVSKISFLNDKNMIIPLIICTMMGVIIPLLVEYISSKIWKLDFVFYPNKYVVVKDRKD